MIKFSLNCENDHFFEGWFSSGNDYETQLSRGLVACPVCNSQKIEKSLMTPSIASGKDSVTASSDKMPADPVSPTISKVPEQFARITRQMKALRDYVKENSDNVGRNFTSEARKIHYGEAEKRGIYGQAEPDDIKELIEEGVEIMPLPEFPEDLN